MMESTMRRALLGSLALGWLAAVVPPPARSQMAMSGGRPLGGYGASTITSYYGSGGGYIPYNGHGGSILPSNGGSGGVMSGQPTPRMIPQIPIGGASMVAATPIGGISAAGGMGMGMGSRGGMGRGMGARSGRRAYAPLLPGGGMGMGSGMGATRSGGMGQGRSAAGPGIGYPFRMPMEFGGGGSSAMGM